MLWELKLWFKKVSFIMAHIICIDPQFKTLLNPKRKETTQIYRHNFMTWILQDFKGFSMQDSNPINGSWQCHIDHMSYHSL
jgi:hypothetical protein